MKPAPRTLRGVMQMNSAVTFGGSRLGRRREELIATATSCLSDCFCMNRLADGLGVIPGEKRRAWAERLLGADALAAHDAWGASPQP